jgi:ComF family protein
MLNTVLKIIYPSFCRSCSSITDQEQIFCFACQSKIKPVVPIFLPLAKKYVIPVHAVCAYADPVKSLIFKKFSYDTLACKQLANLMFDFVPFEAIKADFLIPVPLHWTRYAWRGYNQTELIAKQLSKKLDTPVLNIVKRKNRTIFQSKLNSEQRQKNVEKAFALRDGNDTSIKDKTVIIIDDLFTTGATVKNVAKLLATLQPTSIYIAVACRAI